MKNKRCTLCKEVQPIDNFCKHRGTKNGLSLWCRKCMSRRGEEYRRTSRGIYTTLKARIVHREKRKLYFTRDEFVEWYNSQEKKCVYCGLSEEEFITSFQPHYKRRMTRLTIDRKDNDGGYTLNNIVIACHRCNSIKSDWFSFEEMKEITEKYIIPRIEKWRNPKNREIRSSLSSPSR